MTTPFETKIVPKNFQASLQSALAHARATDENAEVMADHLHETARKDGEGKTVYRRFAAAAAYLEAEPDAILKGEGGTTFSDPRLAIPALLRQQQRMDVELGLTEPTTSTTSVFAGVAR